jgi:hypothetical protein
MRVWPSFVSPNARAWFLGHKIDGMLETGRVAVTLDESNMLALAAKRAIPEDAVSVEGTMQDGQLAFMAGLPPLSGLAGSFNVTGKRATFVATAGFMETATDRRLTLADGRFEAGDFGTGLVRGLVNVRATGAVDAATDLIAAEGMKPFGGFAGERGLVRGQVDGRITVDLFMEPARPPAVKVATQISNLVVERVVGRERLDQGTRGGAGQASGQSGAHRNAQVPRRAD